MPGALLYSTGDSSVAPGASAVTAAVATGDLPAGGGHALTRWSMMATSGSTPSGFVGRQRELRVLGERLAAAGTGHPQVVLVEGEAGGGKSTLLSRFLGSLANAVVLQVAGDEAETLLSYGIIDQLQPGP